MADTPALITINDVVTRYLLKYRKTLDDAVIYTEHAAECLKSWQLYSDSKVNIEKVEIDSNYVIMLCDDDALYPEYFNNLNTYFTNNPEEKYVYSHIHTYDPVLTKIEDNPPYEHHHLNKTHPLNPHFNIDMSQVCWNREEFIKSNIRFPYPMTVNLDAVIYNQMYNAFGQCKFSGFIGEYKGLYKGGYRDQLSHRMGDRLAELNNPEDIFKITIK